MRALVRRWFALPSQDRRLLREAMMLLCLARTAVWLLPFRLLAHPVAFLLRQSANAPMSTPADLARHVARAALYVPFSTCLVQALAGLWMLARRGYRPELCLGVALPGGNFCAHAWLVHEGRTLLGEAEEPEHRLLLKIGRDGLIRSA